jgi:hypothetical protein
MFDRIIAIVDVVLLFLIVIQGESIRWYEREVYRMNRERFDERKKWREAKQKSTLKKGAIGTNDTSNDSTSESNSTTLSSQSKTANAESAGDPPPTSQSA